MSYGFISKEFNEKEAEDQEKLALLNLYKEIL